VCVCVCVCVCMYIYIYIYIAAAALDRRVSSVGDRAWIRTRLRRALGRWCA